MTHRVRIPTTLLVTTSCVLHGPTPIVGKGSGPLGPRGSPLKVWVPSVRKPDVSHLITCLVGWLFRWGRSNRRKIVDFDPSRPCPTLGATRATGPRITVHTLNYKCGLDYCLSPVYHVHWLLSEVGSSLRDLLWATVGGPTRWSLLDEPKRLGQKSGHPTLIRATDGPLQPSPNLLYYVPFPTLTIRRRPLS